MWPQPAHAAPPCARRKRDDAQLHGRRLADSGGFWQAISPLLRQAAEAGQPVHVFGEMVSLLWDAGLIDAAMEVEAMWNELGGQYPFSLLSPTRHNRYLRPPPYALTEVCRVHTQVIDGPPEAQ